MTQNSNPILRDNLEEWDGMRGARDAQEEEHICILRADYVDVW